MAVDWVELSRVIPYGGVALLLIIVVVYLLDRQDKKDHKLEELRTAREAARDAARAADQKRQDEKDAARDARFINAMAERDTRFTKAFGDMARDWQEAALRDRERQVETGTQVARELERVAALVSITNTLIERHDQWERAVFESGRRRGDTGPLGEKKS